MCCESLSLWHRSSYLLNFPHYRLQVLLSHRNTGVETIGRPRARGLSFLKIRGWALQKSLSWCSCLELAVPPFRRRSATTDEREKLLVVTNWVTCEIQYSTKWIPKLIRENCPRLCLCLWAYVNRYDQSVNKSMHAGTNERDWCEEEEEET